VSDNSVVKEKLAPPTTMGRSDQGRSSLTREYGQARPDSMDGSCDVTNLRSGTMNPSAWMEALADGTCLAGLSIPGTNQSCALEIDGANWFEVFAAHQDATVYEQLVGGVRFLDVRCQVTTQGITAYPDLGHKHRSLGNVFDQCGAFLREYPSETILLKVKQERSSMSLSAFGRMFYQDFVRSRPYISQQVNVLRLGPARGKVLLVSDPHRLVGGLEWSDASRFTRQGLCSGCFPLGRRSGFADRLRGAGDAVCEAEGKRFFVTAVPNKFPSFCTPKRVALAQNRRVSRFLAQAEHRRGRYGVIIMDFAPLGVGSLIQQIIETNFS